MDEKPPPSRRSSGHSEKSKKSGKKKKKSKHKEKDRKRSKISSPDETNSDSALELLGRDRDGRASKKSNPSVRSSGSTSKSSTSVGARKSKSSNSTSSTISEARSQDQYLKKCVSDIFERRRETMTLQSPTRFQTRSATVRKSADVGSREFSNGKDSPETAGDEVDEVLEAFNESLRWENTCSDPKDEQERIRIYKINRRKRYLMDVVTQRHDKEGVLKFARELASQDGR